MKCPICSYNNISSLKTVAGYVEGTNYAVFNCDQCETQFVSTKYYKDIYDIIYSQDTHGYSRYSEYIKRIKKVDEPLLWLAYKEPAYLYVYEYLQHKEPLAILEVGCGEGYLTYAIDHFGHYVTGIDISQEAIKVAKENFNPKNYEAVSIEAYKPKDKFDLIVLTETIEHLPNPIKFLEECKRLLTANGKILITTPNKDFRDKNTTWQTELPPVHRFWFGHNSFKHMAKKLGLECEFLPLKMPIGFDRNLYIAFLSSRGNKIQLPTLDKDGKPLKSKENAKNSKFRTKVRNILMYEPVRYTSNAIYNLMLNMQPPTLGVILR